MKTRALIIILRISGLLLITAFIAVFLPSETMGEIHAYLGLGEFPNAPIVDYLARSLSMFYGIHGVIVFYISFNLIRYLPILKLLCYLGFLLSVSLFIIDIQAPMPASWTYGEAPSVFIINLIIYIMAVLVERENNT